MPSRFSFAAMAVAAPLLLAACEREAQQEAETGQAEEPQTAETEAAQPAAPAQPQPDEPPAAAEQQAATEQQTPAAEPDEQVAAEPQQGAADGEGEVTVIPPAGESAPAGEQQTAQAPDRQPAAQAPGEPAPQAAGVASVAAYVGRWAAEERVCQSSYWTFTNLRLQTPGGIACDIQDTTEQEDGVELDVACTEEDDPLAEPERGTISLAFPNLPQTDTMAVSGEPVESEARTLIRCPLG